MIRPLTLAALLYTGGILLARFVSLPLMWLFAATFVLAVAAISVERERSLLLMALLVAFGAVNLTTRTAILSPVDLRSRLGDGAEIVTLRGTLTATPEHRVYFRDEQPSWRTLAEVDVAALERKSIWQTAFGRVAAVTPGLLSADFFAGKEVEISGVIHRPQSAAAEGLFDYRAYLREQGIYFLLKADRTNDWQLATNAPPARPLEDRFREWAQRTLAKGLPEEDEPLRLLWAMVLGWKPALTNEVAEPFMRTGTLHVFAISGLHIALITWILVAVLRVLQIPRAACGLIVIPLIWFYTAATGWQASAIRSTIMMTIIVAGWSLKRPSDLLNSLAMAGLVILVWEPRQLFQAGFQLSFFVVLGLALITPSLQKVRQWLLRTDPLLPDELRPRWQRWSHAVVSWLTASFATSLAAWLGSLPLIAYYFHIVTPVGLLANVVIVPLSGLALASSLGALLCGDWVPWLTVLFNHSSWLWMKLMADLSTWMATWPKAFFFVRAPNLALLVIYYGLLASLLSGWVLHQQRWKWALAVLGLCATATGFHIYFSAPTTSITVPPLGGSGIWINGPGRKADLLIDCSDESGAELLLKPLLRAQGVNRIPNLILTHGDLHHVGGLQAVERDFSVAHILTSSLRFRSPIYREIVQRLETTPQRRQLHRGDQLGPWRVLHPAATDSFAQADDGAIVLLGELFGTRVLLLSDLGRNGQRMLVEREADLKADVVVAGFPAQSEPLSAGLLAAIQPQVIILASAEYPASARANQQLSRRLEASGIRVSKLIKPAQPL